MMYRGRKKWSFPRIVTPKGFSTIELIVAVALFTIVMLVSVGALLTTSAVNARVQSSRNVTDNLNLAVENIARTMRTGIDYHCGDADGTPAGDPLVPRSCTSSPGSFISYTAAGRGRVAFRLNSTANALEFSENCTSTGCTDWLGVTAPEITISQFSIYVAGTSAGDDIQPKALIVVRGSAGLKGVEVVNFNLQTTVTQRILDS